MNGQSISIFYSILAMLTGGVIGLLFGSLQNGAFRRNKLLRTEGRLKNGWMIMPGSMSRVAVLLVILVVIQAACPVLFNGNIQWMVSAGLLLGYGYTLLRHLRMRVEDHRSSLN